MHVVITGAGGFVGGYLARWFTDQGALVTAVTRRSPPAYLSRGKLSWREADLRAPDALPNQFDVLIHCAAEIPTRCPDPAALYQANTGVARKVFERALDANAQAVIFMSSMSVYGTISVPVVTEETLSFEPDAYGRSKRDSEIILQECVLRGLPSAFSIRLPGTVGKGSHDNFLSSALARVLEGEEVVVTNENAMFNNVVYVGDLARFVGNWLVCPGVGYSLTNLAAVQPMRMGEVIATLFKDSNRPLRITTRQSDRPSFIISDIRARQLGYSPLTVRESLRAFVQDVLAS